MSSFTDPSLYQELFARLDASESVPPSMSQEAQDRLYAIGYEQYNQGRYQQAYEVFSRLVRQDMFSASYYKALGACQENLGRNREAVLSYGLAWLFDPSRPDVLLHLGECLSAEKMIDEAISTLETCVSEAKDDEAHASNYICPLSVLL